MPTTRERILTEGTRQLTQHGYAAFTLASVREALNISSGSLFHAFESKPALAAAVYVDGMARYQRAATAAISRHAPPAGAIGAWIGTHLSWVEDHRELSRYLFSTLPEEVTALAAAPLAEHNAVYFAEIASLFSRAAAAGLMARIERPVAQALSIGPAQDYCRQWCFGLAATPPRKFSRVFQDAAIAALSATVDTHPKQRKEMSR